MSRPDIDVERDITLALVRIEQAKTLLDALLAAAAPRSKGEKIGLVLSERYNSAHVASVQLRRALLSMLALAALDPERLIWQPGKKLISIPPAPKPVSLYYGQEYTRIVFEGTYMSSLPLGLTLSYNCCTPGRGDHDWVRDSFMRAREATP